MGRLGRRAITKAKPVETHVTAELLKEKTEKKEDTKVKLIKQKSKAKTKPFQMRFTEKEFEAIAEFAKKEEINISDLIRIALIEKGVL